MSFDELLSTIRALPRAEQVRLMHLLVDELTRPDLPLDDVIQGSLFMQAVHGPEGAVMAAELERLLNEQQNGTSAV